jgi:hypothetical protein
MKNPLIAFVSEFKMRKVALLNVGSSTDRSDISTTSM